MAKLQYTRFEDVSKNRLEAIDKLNNLVRSFGEPVMIMYYDQYGQRRTLVALFRSDLKGDYILQYDEEDDGEVADLENLINQMLDYNKDLASPKISGSWSYYTSSGIPTTISPEPDKLNPQIERGYKARYLGVYSWTLGEGQKPPIKVTPDSDWKDLPIEGITSGSFNSSQFSVDATVKVGIQAPKTGLMVVGDSVRLAEGVDKRYDTRSIRFLDRYYYGPSNKMSGITGEDIKSLKSTGLISSRLHTIKGISTDKSEYFVYAYPKHLGELEQIIQNGSISVLGAFNKSEVRLINLASLEIDYLVYTSNNPGAFTNVKLEFK